MVSAVFFVLGPVLALRYLGGASGWGVVSSAMTVGSLLGGLLAFWIKARRPLAFGMAVTMLTALPSLTLALRLPLYVLVVAAVIRSTGGVVLNTNWDTVVQQIIPNEMLSRFRSYDYLLAFLAIPIGDGIAGPLASAFGASDVLFAMAALAIIANGIPAILPAVRAVVRNPDGTITAPEMAVAETGA
jgi:hypothetical protein